MLRTRWLLAALAAGGFGIAMAQGAGGGAGGGKDPAGTAGTQPSPRTDMQEGTAPSGAAAATTSGTAAAAASGANEVATTLAKLHVGHEAEVQAGHWMQAHATNTKVKDFAKKMVKDHTAMDKDVNDYARKHDIALTGVAGVDAEQAKHKEALDRLEGMQGAQADRHYMQMMVEDHTRDVSEVGTAAQQAKQGHDDQYTKLLENTQKKMKSHLEDAQKISRDLGARQARHPAQ